jgi:4-hydroxy-3-polyprenylbenzoate decarboxylase
VPLPHITDLIRRREERGELIRISEPVAAHSELAEFVRQISRHEPGHAILFEEVTGSRFSVVANLWSSRPSLAEGLEADSLDQVWERLDPQLDADSLGLSEPTASGWNWLKSLRGSGKAVPAQRNSPGQQIVHLGRDVNLAMLPIPRFDCGESGPTITAAQVLTAHPLSGDRTLSHATLEAVSADTLAVHWLPHDAAWDALAAARVNHRQLPVAIVLGSTAPWLVAAESSLVTGIDPWRVAQRVAASPLEVSRARTIELDVPTEAEFLIEGVINSDCDFHSGRISTPLGTIAQAGPSPIMQCTAITHRAKPVFPITLPEPCREQGVRLAARSALATRALQACHPDIAEAAFPPSGGGATAYLRLRKKYAHQGRQALHAAWGLQPTATAKLVVVVDEDVSLDIEAHVWTAIARNVDPSRDVIMSSGPSIGWDVTSLVNAPGGKIGIDATRKLPGEVDAERIPYAAEHDADLVQRVRQRLAACGITV